MTGTITTICKNCGNHFTGKFCNACGQKLYAEKDKSLSHILHEALHFFTHLDNKFFRTILAIFGRPGLVSLTYCNGNRAKYYKPFSLFFVGVILYLVFPFLPGLNMSFNNNMINHRAQGLGFVMNLVDHKLAARGMTISELANVYDARSSNYAKILLLVILPLTALALRLLFFRRKKYFFDHLILATEASSITLYLIFFILPVLLFLSQKLFGFSGRSSAAITTDIITMSATGIFLLLWSIVAFKRFYRIGYLHALVKAVLFLIFHFIIIYFLYKLILFLTILIFI